MNRGVNMNKDECTSEHTPCPVGYYAWHEWAGKKGRTHRQVKCKACGLYVIWVKRKKRVKS